MARIGLDLRCLKIPLVRLLEATSNRSLSYGSVDSLATFSLQVADLVPIKDQTMVTGGR